MYRYGNTVTMRPTRTFADYVYHKMRWLIFEQKLLLAHRVQLRWLRLKSTEERLRLVEYVCGEEQSLGFSLPKSVVDIWWREQVSNSVRLGTRKLRGKFHPRRLEDGVNSSNKYGVMGRQTLFEFHAVKGANNSRKRFLLTLPSVLGTVCVSSTL